MALYDFYDIYIISEDEALNALASGSVPTQDALGIYGPKSLGSGLYQVQLVVSGNADEVNVGDLLVDHGTNKYKVEGWQDVPYHTGAIPTISELDSTFADGLNNLGVTGVGKYMKVSFIDTDSIPVVMNNYSFSPGVNGAQLKYVEPVVEGGGGTAGRYLPEVAWIATLPTVNNTDDENIYSCELLSQGNAISINDKTIKYGYFYCDNAGNIFKIISYTTTDAASGLYSVELEDINEVGQRPKDGSAGIVYNVQYGAVGLIQGPLIQTLGVVEQDRIKDQMHAILWKYRGVKLGNSSITKESISDIRLDDTFIVNVVETSASYAITSGDIDNKILYVNEDITTELSEAPSISVAYSTDIDGNYSVDNFSYDGLNTIITLRDELPSTTTFDGSLKLLEDGWNGGKTLSLSINTDTLSSDVQTNSTRIDTISGDVQTNLANIDTLSGDVQSNTNNISTHINNTSSHQASTITLNTTNFDNNLSIADNTVQKALETLDELVGGGSPTSGSIVSLDTTNFDNNLSIADNTVQKAFETLDELAGGGGGSSTLDGLTDVTITSAQPGDALTYDGLTSRWINQDLASMAPAGYGVKATPIFPNIDDCILHFDADGDENFIFTTGDNLGVWLDKSGNANNLAALINTGEPQRHIAAAPTGRNGVAFNYNPAGAWGTLISGFTNNVALPVSTGTTVFMVFQAISYSTNSYLINGTGTGWSGIRSLVGGILRSQTGADGADRTFGTGDWVSSPAVMSWQPYRLSDGLAKVDININTAFYHGINAGTFNSTSFVLGQSNAPTTNTGWRGYIFEVLIYNRELNETENLQIRTYLFNKWTV